MKRILTKFALITGCIPVLFSCGTSDASSWNGTSKKDSARTIERKIVDFDKAGNNEGIVGVFDVPEMLTICKLDSARMKDVSFKVAQDYSVLESEMNAIGAELDGMPGMLTYTNDTSNFVFECVLPIKAMPKKQPKNCKIVALEASKMLIYNFYGPYENLFSAYDKVRKHILSSGLQQSGPMREFYLSDPTVEKDPAKWQTRIMIPVIVIK